MRAIGVMIGDGQRGFWVVGFKARAGALNRTGDAHSAYEIPHGIEESGSCIFPDLTGFALVRILLMRSYAASRCVGAGRRS
jgi:hypothetical protein